MFDVITTPGTAASFEAAPALTAHLTGISSKTLAKAAAAGFIPELTVATALAVGELPMLESARTPNGLPVPLVRMGVQGAATDDGHHVPPRRYHGLGAGMTDSEFLDSVVRWWKPSGQSHVLSSGYLLVVIGGITVGLVGGIDGVETYDDRIEYVGENRRLIARADDVVSRTIRIVTDELTDDEREFARTVLATRSTTRGGGVIGVLDADLS